MDATENTEAPEVNPEVPAVTPEDLGVAPDQQKRDEHVDYIELMRKQQAIAVELELQAIAARNQSVGELIAERDALRKRVAELESGAPKRKAKA